MGENIKDILKKQLLIVSPSKEELDIIEVRTDKLVSQIKENLFKNKLKAEVFIGGSFAKNTLIKKNKYDVDIFVRFDSKLENISNILEKIVPKNALRIHGSRDYFSVKEGNLEFEIIPTIKINKPQDAQNITDLSYFHVVYLEKKFKKNSKLVDEIRLAKAFTHYQDCYGAESYIHGFSGYALELLIVHYKTFLNFLKAVVSYNGKKPFIIDSDRLYRGEDMILKHLNESKLKSPIILIDPTFKERNALAALNKDTFDKFKISAAKFLKSPSNKFFEYFDKESAFKKKYKDFLELRLFTSKQAGDIAGTKIKKFYLFFLNEIKMFFDIFGSEFIYDEKDNIGRVFISLSKKKELIIPGPPVEMKDCLGKFKKEHKNVKIKQGKAYAIEKSIEFGDFLDKFTLVKQKTISQMDIERIEKV
jgi:tRNA nucleotidyltransferase (CCA-adding enzyme)